MKGFWTVVMISGVIIGFLALRISQIPDITKADIFKLSGKTINVRCRTELRSSPTLLFSVSYNGTISREFTYPTKSGHFCREMLDVLNSTGKVVLRVDEYGNLFGLSVDNTDYLEVDQLLNSRNSHVSTYFGLTFMFLVINFSSYFHFYHRQNA